MARQWWPLAASWVFMTAELVVFTAIVARLPNPEIQLAAWGVVFALSTLVQSPSTVLLPTSTALARDALSFRRLSTFAWSVLATLTVVHALLATTPLYGFVVDRLLGIPAEVAEAARVALVVMLPWSFGTGLRRFLQGVMIRYGRATVVIWGTFVRLGVGTAVMLVGAYHELLPGAQLAAVAIIAGVLGEAAYTRLRATAVIRRHLARVDVTLEPLTLPRFIAFFSPLVLMILLTMLVQTLVTVALGRMPDPLASLAAWPVLFAFLMILQSPGMAYTEVVISLLRRRGAVRTLRRSTWTVAAAITATLLALALTPAAATWFRVVAGLSDELVTLARGGLLLAVAVPALRILLSWYQGVIMYGERTRAILESVIAFLLVAVGVLTGGILWAAVPGVYVGVVAMTAAMTVQAVWLAYRARSVLGGARAAGPVPAAPVATAATAAADGREDA